MMRDDTLILQRMAEHIAKARDYLATTGATPSRIAFLEDMRLQDAMLRRIELLTDAAGRLSETVRGRYPESFWLEASELNNTLMYGYLDLDPRRMWDELVM